ncbi:GCN5-related N-acetyltransferase [Desulfobulbus propionicus DSM 2032]|uniref:GCN5-related N-acetyltransferase n=1 Tax=Desulfobulbus propionicus (strain ATCC 33891 / DSM 2032 / VKM B-1956 / 1pr3) TaxID=577650 RepID=A0A7U4DP60_DESPD|nr:GNAT family N-acetyltransferase [Desulfobulbus propionicus]ADW17709.1 GCN5-related N-acetyltransferase [Desulfobulbus propionicus DSM 2032]
MKIRPLAPDTQAKAAALLHHAFAPSTYEVRLFDALHANGRQMVEWVCLHRDAVIAYIGFTRAYRGQQAIGLHLGPLAVQPRVQGQGIGSELLRFALRQERIKGQPIFALGCPRFFRAFGFVPCTEPLCPLTRDTGQFLVLGNTSADRYTVGYEPEFTTVKKRQR